MKLPHLLNYEQFINITNRDVVNKKIEAKHLTKIVTNGQRKPGHK